METKLRNFVGCAALVVLCSCSDSPTNQTGRAANLTNYKFKIDEWLPRFPLEERYGHYSGENITSPWDICNNEQLRQEMQDQYDWGPEVAVDIFIMAEGEPEDRHVTKIGGLPYRPANARWPTTAGGQPMLFIAQFNFRDSKDLTGDLPGELLLVFGDDSSGILDDLHMEWQSLGMTDLIESKDVPEHPSAFDPCYGHIFRTASYPEARQVVPYDKQKYPKYRGKDVLSDYFLLQYQATQIGQAPFFIQQGDDRLPGRPLCTISSVQPDQHKPYPWINHPEPLQPEGEWSFDDNYLMLGDLGCIYIFIDGEGESGKCRAPPYCGKPDSVTRRNPGRLPPDLSPLPRHPPKNTPFLRGLTDTPDKQQPVFLWHRPSVDS